MNTNDFNSRYLRWKNGERYWDIRGIDLPRYDTADKYTEPQVLIPYNTDNLIYNAGTLPEIEITSENKLGVTPTDLPDIYRTTNGDFVHVDRGNSKNALSFINPYDGKRVYTDEMLAENARANKRYENFEKDRALAQSMGLDPILPFQDIANGLYKKAFNDTMNSLAWFGGVGGALARGYVGTRNMFSDDGISKTADLFNQGLYGRGVLSALGDTLNLSLAMPITNKIIGIGKQTLIPSNRAAHAYYTISPVGYEDVSGRAKNWIKSMLTGKYPDIENPTWLNDPGLTTLKDYINPIVENPTALTTQARVDAWRIYNRLPQKYNTFIKRTDGSYYYDLNKIKKLTNNTMTPFSPDGLTIDYLGSAGGHVNINPVYSKLVGMDPVNNTLTKDGIDIMSDIWDLHPFNKTGNSFANKTINAYRNVVVPKILNFRLFLFDKNIVGMRAKYPFSSYVNRLENNTLNRLRFRIPFENIIYKISDKLKDFEIGTVSGGKPFLVRTVIPYHHTYSQMLLKGFGVVKSIDGGLGFSDKYIHPIKIHDLNKFNEEYTQLTNMINK